MMQVRDKIILPSNIILNLDRQHIVYMYTNETPRLFNFIIRRSLKFYNLSPLGIV